MNIGDKVTIGGRTMLKPGFSLVGLEGIIMPSAPQTPAGCTTLLIDWVAQGYDSKDDLPMIVNVPTAHLEAAEPGTKADIELPRLSGNATGKRPALGLVIDEKTATPTSRAEQSSDDASEVEERPRLRLL